jgi:hypothetical protein
MAVARGVDADADAGESTGTIKLSSRLTREEALRHEETLVAWPVCCSDWFGVLTPCPK